MTIKDKLQADMKQAMRDKNQTKLETVRMLRAEIQRKEVDEQVTASDDDVLNIIQKMIKQTQSAIEQFKAGGRDDLVAKDEAFIASLKEYLPAQMSDEEIDKMIASAIAETGAGSVKDMGQVMAWLKPKLQGKADMSKVGPKVKSQLA